MQRDPLAVCEWRSLAQEDVTEAGVLQGTGEEALKALYSAVRPSAAQQWRYFSTMQPGEALLFKTWDSSTAVAQTVHFIRM